MKLLNYLFFSMFGSVLESCELTGVCLLLPCIALTSQIMLINVTDLDISVSNIPITPRHGLFCVCPRPIRDCITIQHRLWLSERAQNDPYKASKYNVVYYNMCMIQSY